MKKVFKKTTALLLTFVMLFALAVPMVSAEDTSTQSTTYPTYDEAANGDLLWELDFTKYAETKSPADANSPKITVSQEKYRADSTNVFGGWTEVIGGAIPELPLNKNSVYTVQFSYNTTSSGLYSIFRVDDTLGFYLTNYTVAGRYTGEKKFDTNNGRINTNDVVKFIGKDPKGELGTETYKRNITYRVVLDAPNGVMKLYMLTEGDIWTLLTMRSDYVPKGETLALYFEGQLTKGWQAIVFSDVNIYKGTFYDSVTTEEPGDKLLTIADMSETQNGEQNVIYTPGINYDKSGATVQYVYADGVHSLTDTSGSYREFGGKTNLPLGNGHKYTIKYSCKPIESAGIAFSALGNQASQTVRLTKLADGGAQLLLGFCDIEGDYTFKTPVVLDSTIFSDEGYVDVAIEIDGYNLAVFIKGEKKLECDMLTRTYNTGAGYSSDLLTLAIAEKATAGTEASSFKDIELYSGLVMSYNYYKLIEDESYEYVQLDKSVESYTLPKLSKEGYMFKGWKVNGSDTFTSSGETLTVSEIDTLEKVFVPVMFETWYQSEKILDENENDTGKRNVRFVSVIDSLNYSSVGYNVTIKYQNESHDVNDFNLKYVYESLKASYGAEIMTLESLGYDGDGYLVAFVIKNVPTSVGDITVELTPYRVNIDGTKDVGTKIVTTLSVDDLNK